MANPILSKIKNKKIKNLQLKKIEEQLVKSKTKAPASWAELIVLYKVFLYLKWLYPNKKLIPPYYVDLVWHQHILNTTKYFNDCSEIFGHFVHHNAIDELDTKKSKKWERETIQLVEKHFGQEIAGTNVS